MASIRGGQQIAFVVDVRGHVAENRSTVQELAGLLADQQTAATWIVDSSPVASAIAKSANSKALFDFAVPCQLASSSDLRAGGRSGMLREVDSLLANLRSQGVKASVVASAAEQEFRGYERAFGNLGVEAVVVGASRSPVRSLPGGLWQFRIGLSLPRRRSWTSAFSIAGSGAQMQVMRANGDVAYINVSRLHTGRATAMHHVAKFVRRTNAAGQTGLVSVTSVRDLARLHRTRFAHRPQRSILAAA